MSAKDADEMYAELRRRRARTLADRDLKVLKVVEESHGELTAFKIAVAAGFLSPSGQYAIHASLARLERAGKVQRVTGPFAMRWRTAAAPG